MSTRLLRAVDNWLVIRDTVDPSVVEGLNVKSSNDMALQMSREASKMFTNHSAIFGILIKEEAECQ